LASDLRPGSSVNGTPLSCSRVTTSAKLTGRNQPQPGSSLGFGFISLANKLFALAGSRLLLIGATSAAGPSWAQPNEHQTSRSAAQKAGRPFQVLPSELAAYCLWLNLINYNIAFARAAIPFVGSIFALK